MGKTTGDTIAIRNEFLPDGMRYHGSETRTVLNHIHNIELLAKTAESINKEEVIDAIYNRVCKFLQDHIMLDMTYRYGQEVYTFEVKGFDFRFNDVQILIHFTNFGFHTLHKRDSAFDKVMKDCFDAVVKSVYEMLNHRLLADSQFRNNITCELAEYLGRQYNAHFLVSAVNYKHKLQNIPEVID